VSVSREELLKQCERELDVRVVDTKCHRCGGTGKIHVSVGDGYMGYGLDRVRADDEIRDCPECTDIPSDCHLPPTLDQTYDPYFNYKTDTDAAMRDLKAFHGGSSNQCSRCGGSLSIEEYHDCDREMEWQERYGI
jgi:hypothetical protein